MRKLLIFTFFLCSNLCAQDLVSLYEESGVTAPIFFDKSHYKSNEYSTFGITEIGIQKTSCFGHCPAFMLKIKTDGTVYYEGYGFVDKLGQHNGKLKRYQLENILAYINEIDFMDLQDVYSVDITDQPSVYTMVKTQSQQKIIKNYANTGPMTLWALEQLMTQLLNEVRWLD